MEIWIFFIKAFVYETSWHYDWEPNVYPTIEHLSKLAPFFSGDTE